MKWHNILRCACVLLALACGLTVQAGSRQVLKGHVPDAVRGRAAVGRLDAGTNLLLAIGLPLRNPEALTNLLQQICDPASPQYHHYLTPEQFTKRFGPTKEDYQAVVAFARRNGLEVAAAYPDRHVVDVRGAAADVERAFQVTLREYRHPSEPRLFYAPDTDPTVDATVPIADVWGLSNYPRPRPASPGPRPLGQTVAPNAGSGPSGAYRGSDFRNAYAPGLTSLTGAGQTLGLFQADGFYASDIATYVSQAGMSTNIVLQVVLLDGFSGTPYSVNGNGEVSLDIENAIAMAPGLTRIIVYEGNPAQFYPSHILQRIASDNLARQVSSSWSWSGGPSTTIDTYLQQLIAQGQSYFQASGDSDAYPPGAVDNSSNSTAPVDSPYLTCVGGTTLSMSGSGAAWSSETVWNWGGGVGSSGGISSHYAIPSWQAGVSMANNQGSTVYRNLPDVALTADNVYVVYNNGSVGYFGGTSCAAPLWAGLTALINQYAAANSQAAVGFLNPALYAIGKGSGYTAVFHDTTAGDNTSSSSPTNFYAVAGYDLCTGWGTPNGANLLAALFAPVVNLALTGATFSDVAGGNGNGMVDPGETIRETVAWTNMGGLAASNVAATLATSAASVTIVQTNASYPNIPAGGSATNAAPFVYRVAHGVPAGTTLVFTNLLTASGRVFTGTFTRLVGQLQVGGVVTNAFASVDVSKTISSRTTTYSTNTVALAGSNVIDAVAVSVRLDYPLDSDLVLAIQHPDATEVILSSKKGGSGQNYGTGIPPAAITNTVFDDLATTPIGSGSAPFAGTYKPDGVLGNLVGKPANGTWRLRITDATRQNAGTLYAWSLRIASHTVQYTDTVFDNPPLASNQSVQAVAGVATRLVLRGSDPDGDAITFRTNSMPAHGTLSGFNTNSGAIAYKSIPGYRGSDAFTFVAWDGYTSSVPATVSLSVVRNGTVVLYR